MNMLESEFWKKSPEGPRAVLSKINNYRAIIIGNIKKSKIRIPRDDLDFIDINYSFDFVLRRYIYEVVFFPNINIFDKKNYLIFRKIIDSNIIDICNSFRNFYNKWINYNKIEI